jgi:hypothetical protein
MSDIIERLREAALSTRTTERKICDEAADEIEKLRAALKSVLDACDAGYMVERGAGGMTVGSQMRRSFYDGVPAWLIEEARAALGEKE